MELRPTAPVRCWFCDRETAQVVSGRPLALRKGRQTPYICFECIRHAAKIIPKES